MLKSPSHRAYGMILDSGDGLRGPLLFFAVMALSPKATPHDIPADITAHAFVKPEGTRLQLLIRVPMKAMRDIDFPETKQGYLDVERLGPLLPDAAKVWVADAVAMYEDGRRLPSPRLLRTQVSLASDRSFATFEEALRHLGEPMPANGSNLVWNQVLFDMDFEYAIVSDRSQIAIRPGLERLGARVVTVLRFLPPGGAVRAYEFTGDPGVVVLDPRWHQAAGRFIELGFRHILEGTDHLLFLLCMVIPFRRFRPLLVVVTAFTVAHSVTLIASAANLAPDALWFPPLIETLIAASIVYMALDNIIGGSTTHRRWIIAFGFGLIHGFGFSFVLRNSLQFAGSHLLTSLLSFNLGVELGQVLVLVMLIPMLDLLFRYVVAERMGTIILSALVLHTAWHWMTERGERLLQYRFEISWLIVLIAAAALTGTIAFFARRESAEHRKA